MAETTLSMSYKEVGKGGITLPLQDKLAVLSCVSRKRITLKIAYFRFYVLSKVNNIER